MNRASNDLASSDEGMEGAYSDWCIGGVIRSIGIISLLYQYKVCAIFSARPLPITSYRGEQQQWAHSRNF